MQWLIRVSTVDQRMFLALSALSERLSLHYPARYISRTGDGYLQLVLPLTLCLFLEKSRAADFFVVACAAFAIERTLYKILKNSLKRRRPPQFFPSFQSVVEASDEFSFPSGHTCAAFLLMVLCSAVFPILTIPLTLWAIAVGCSRVILGVHFPADILAGMALGYGIGQLAITFL